MQTSVNCNNREIIQKNINSVQLFIKLPLRYLEHLDSLRLGHLKQLMSWVGLYVTDGGRNGRTQPYHNEKNPPYEAIRRAGRKKICLIL